MPPLACPPQCARRYERESGKRQNSCGCGVIQLNLRHRRPVVRIQATTLSATARKSGISMKDPSPVSSPGLSEELPESPLDSWKEIATHVKRDVSTVQRWEKREGMPVHRHVHDKRGSVYAFSSELDAWLQSRKLSLEEEEEEKDHGAERPAEAEGDHRPSHLAATSLVFFGCSGGSRPDWHHLCYDPEPH